MMATPDRDSTSSTQPTTQSSTSLGSHIIPHSTTIDSQTQPHTLKNSESSFVSDQNLSKMNGPIQLNNNNNNNDNDDVDNDNDNDNDDDNDDDDDEDVLDGNDNVDKDIDNDNDDIDMSQTCGEEAIAHAASEIAELRSKIPNTKNTNDTDTTTTNTTATSAAPVKFFKHAAGGPSHVYLSLGPPGRRGIATPAVDTKDDTREYRLTLLQVPKQSRMCGLGEVVDRRPLDPPAVVQLHVRLRGTKTLDPNAQAKVLYNPSYFMYVMLVHPDTGRELYLLPEHRIRYTAGTVVSALYKLRDLNNDEGAFFIFSDLCVRREGTYRLKFVLFEIVHEQIFFRATITSDKLCVYPAKKFPGMAGSTELSKVFAEQGVKIRIRKDWRVKKRGSTAQIQDDDAVDDTPSATAASSRPDSQSTSMPDHHHHHIAKRSRQLPTNQIDNTASRDAPPDHHRQQQHHHHGSTPPTNTSNVSDYTRDSYTSQWPSQHRTQHPSPPPPQPKPQPSHSSTTSTGRRGSTDGTPLSEMYNAQARGQSYYPPSTSGSTVGSSSNQYASQQYQPPPPPSHYLPPHDPTYGQYAPPPPPPPPPQQQEYAPPDRYPRYYAGYDDPAYGGPPSRHSIDYPRGHAPYPSQSQQQPPPPPPPQSSSQQQQYPPSHYSTPNESSFYYRYSPAYDGYGNVAQRGPPLPPPPPHHGSSDYPPYYQQPNARDMYYHSAPPPPQTGSWGYPSHTSTTVSQATSSQTSAVVTPIEPSLLEAKAGQQQQERRGSLPTSGMTSPIKAVESKLSPAKHPSGRYSKKDMQRQTASGTIIDDDRQQPHVQPPSSASSSSSVDPKGTYGASRYPDEYGNYQGNSTWSEQQGGYYFPSQQHQTTHRSGGYSREVNYQMNVPPSHYYQQQQQQSQQQQSSSHYPMHGPPQYVTYGPNGGNNPEDNNNINDASNVDGPQSHGGPIVEGETMTHSHYRASWQQQQLRQQKQPHYPSSGVASNYYQQPPPTSSQSKTTVGNVGDDYYQRQYHQHYQQQQQQQQQHRHVRQEDVNDDYYNRQDNEDNGNSQQQSQSQQQKTQQQHAGWYTKPSQ